MITVFRQLTLILKFIPCAQFIIQFLYQVQLIFFSFASELCRSSILSQLCLSFITFSAQFHLIFVSSSSDFRLIFASQFFLICVLVASWISILCKSLEILKKRAGEGKKHVSHVTNGSRKLVAFFHSPAPHYTTATHHSITWKEGIYQTREILVHFQQQKRYVHRDPRKRNSFITSGTMLI